MYGVRSGLERELAFPLTDLPRHLTLRVNNSGFTMKPAWTESQLRYGEMSTDLYSSPTAIPNLTQMIKAKRHSYLWPEGQGTEASVSGQKSLLNMRLVMLFSKEFPIQPCIGCWHCPLPGAFQHPWLWRQTWLLWAWKRAVSFVSWGYILPLDSPKWLQSRTGLNCTVDLAGYQIPGLWN